MRNQMYSANRNNHNNYNGKSNSNRQWFGETNIFKPILKVSTIIEGNTERDTPAIMRRKN